MTNIQYVTVKQLAQDPAFCFTEAMIRYYLVHRASNGLSFAVRKLGRKTLIRRDLFLNWLETQPQEASV